MQWSARSLRGDARANSHPDAVPPIDYRRALAREVNDRIKVIVEERERTERSASTSGTALTLRKREIVKRECGKNLTWLRSRTRGARHPEAVAAGREDGANVSLDTQIEGTNNTLLLTQN